MTSHLATVPGADLSDGAIQWAFLGKWPRAQRCFHQVLRTLQPTAPN